MPSRLFRERVELLSFSVITPSLNQGEYIEQTIRSGLEQAYDNFEHIVIDGGSSDQTISVLEKYPHLKWLSGKDRGQSDALNKGFTMASGDIIAWINSDDWYMPGTFSLVDRFFTENPDKDIVMGNCHLVDENGTPFDTVRNSARGFCEIRRYWVGRSIPTQPAVFFRRQLFQRYGMLDLNLHFAMDYDLWLRFAKNNYFYHIDKAFACYRFHSRAKGAEQDWSRFRPEWKRAYKKHVPIVDKVTDMIGRGINFLGNRVFKNEG